MKRTADRAILGAATEALSNLGVARRGRSSRYWFEDRGWWRLNVWFEPSSWGVKINLRVGPQILWSLLPHETIDTGPWGGDGVDPYPTGALDGSVGPPETVAAVYASEAASRVQRIHSELGDDARHLESLSRVNYRKKVEGGLDVSPGFVGRVEDVLLANALLGHDEICQDVILSHRNALLTDPSRNESWYGLDRQLAALAELGTIVTSTNPRQLIAERIDLSRAALGMPALVERPTFLSQTLR